MFFIEMKRELDVYRKRDRSYRLVEECLREEIDRLTEKKDDPSLSEGFREKLKGELEEAKIILGHLEWTRSFYPIK